MADERLTMLLRTIAEHRVSHMYLPPTALYGLLASPELGRQDEHGKGATPCRVVREEAAQPGARRLHSHAVCPGTVDTPFWENIPQRVIEKDLVLTPTMHDTPSELAQAYR